MSEIQRIEVSSNDLRSHMANYLDEVIHGGKEIRITRRGKKLRVKLVRIDEIEDNNTEEMHK